MKSTWEIRAFRDEDEEAVVALWRASFPNDPSRNEPRAVIRRKRLVQPDLFLVGLLSGVIVATAIGGYDGFRGWVYHLATAPEHRRRGIARKMMAEVERRLIAIGCPKLNLQVRSSNKEVVAFYKSIGYEVEDHTSLGKEFKTGAP